MEECALYPPLSASVMAARPAYAVTPAYSLIESTARSVDRPTAAGQDVATGNMRSPRLRGHSAGERYNQICAGLLTCRSPTVNGQLAIPEELRVHRLLVWVSRYAGSSTA